ncbi:MAG: hypothetical protein MI919_42055 [Holophagales bacterium]|nr:hypothetical protein [Holophagales bacterium]
MTSNPRTLSAAFCARHLPALVDRLRAARYSVGPDELVTVHRLLTRLASEGHGYSRAESLARMLAPVLCKSAAEQRDFGDHFEAWLTATTRARQLARQKAPRESAAPTRRVPEPAPVPRKRVRVWLLVAVIPAVLGLAYAVHWIVMQNLPAETYPEARARVGFTSAGRAASSRVELAPTPFVWTVVLAVGLWILPLYFLWLHGGWLPAWLTRRSTFDLPALDRLSLSGTEGRLGERWRGLRHLGDRDLHADESLDVEETVRATIEAGGYFTPVHGHRPELPEYLALIDRRNPEDHLARFSEEMTRRLRERDLVVRTLFYSGDPRFGAGGPGLGYTPLETLSHRAQGARLLVFSDIEPWLEQDGEPARGSSHLLSRWHQRFLLTPVPLGEWGPRERSLAGGSLPVFPLDDEGLSALAESITARAPASLAQANPWPGSEAAGGPLPRSLRQDAERWLEETSPPAPAVGELIASLDDYLTPQGMLWLRACAAFPAVTWSVTCYLGRELSEDGDRSARQAGADPSLLTDRLLLRLSRLPWFRYGRIPDWLRLELIRGLGRAEGERVRRSLRNLLVQAAPTTELAPGPEIAQEPLRWGRGGRLSRWLASQPDASPLRDFLFLSFMRGSKPLPLTLATPRRLRAWIRDTDRWSVAASALLALAGTVAVGFAFQIANIEIDIREVLGETARFVPTSPPTSFPEAVIVLVNFLVAFLLVARAGQAQQSIPVPEEPAVPALIERISKRRWQVIVPPVATLWVGFFVLAELGGAPDGLRWLFAYLAAALALGGAHLYLDLHHSAEARARLDGIERRLRPNAGGGVAREILAFLRDPAPGELERRALLLLHSRIREPTPELVAELAALQHGCSLERRNQHLLDRIVRTLDQRARDHLRTGDPG